MFRQRYTCCHIRHTYISLDPRRAGGIFEAPLLKDYDLIYKNTLHNNLEAVLFALRAIYSIANEYKLKRLGVYAKLPESIHSIGNEVYTLAYLHLNFVGRGPK